MLVLLVFGLHFLDEDIRLLELLACPLMHVFANRPLNRRDADQKDDGDLHGIVFGRVLALVEVVVVHHHVRPLGRRQKLVVRFARVLVLEDFVRLCHFS